MPGQDGTGSLGRGPLTGRGFGPCGRGLGWRRGFGRGFGWNEPVELSNEEQKKILEAEKVAIDKRLEELK
ncbi:MAG TPA: DUF5320 domain-containing protein [Candidatus Nanoarchaeia archaeon]|nr:DUF5320 domain-containing protein [Candidatus Nanoarchaeia archaeon]